MANLTTEDLCERLRRENYEHFIVLVRMHLSFVLDLNTDDNEIPDKCKSKKWNLVPFAKKSKTKGIMDGLPLTQEGICQIYQLIEFLKKDENITVEGIFRKTGSLPRQQELKNLLNQGVTLNLERGIYSVHDCASVLKGFLSELPEPLLTESHYPAYCQIAELCGITQKQLQPSRLLHSLQLLLLLLPPENKSLLKDLLDLLNLTSQHEPQNKMSADNLATLFTPHLLCPKKLSPETLHVNSRTIAGIISFMITECVRLFATPPKLAVDIKAYYAEKARREIAAAAAEDSAVNTVFTFVDVERTSKENESNPTETALAQLYAHIQGLPESSRKRKLVKQFNRENGHGTPLQVLRGREGKSGGGKGLSESIRSRFRRKGRGKGDKGEGEEALLKPVTIFQPITVKTRLFCATKCESDDSVCSNETAVTELQRSSPEKPETPRLHVTSTPAPSHSAPFTPEQHERQSMSPITKSTQRMCRAMQETMMTPRSRKPVLLVSGTNIATLPTTQTEDGALESLSEETQITTPSIDDSTNETIPKKKTKHSDDNSLTSTFLEYLENRSISPTDLSFSSRTDDYSSTDFKDISEDKLSASLVQCLDGMMPDEKEFVLKPKQFDENGMPVMYETSF